VSHYATNLLAFRDMKTLYLRNVPDEVVSRLERLAARDGTSVGAVAVRELTDVSRRADNPALLGSLADLGVDAGVILDDLDAGRARA
jgi:plasmid stability protein